jgi:hypothetical protein
VLYFSETNCSLAQLTYSCGYINVLLLSFLTVLFTALLACRLILLNDVQISSFGLVLVSELANYHYGDNSFSNLCPQS